MTMHGVHLYISDNHLGFFFATFGEVSIVSPIKSKVGIATGDVEIVVAVTRKNFIDIPNIMICERTSSLRGSRRSPSSLLSMWGSWLSLKTVP